MKLMNVHMLYCNTMHNYNLNITYWPWIKKKMVYLYILNIVKTVKNCLGSLN